MKVVLDHLTKRFASRQEKGKDVIAVNDFNFEIPEKRMGRKTPGRKNRDCFGREFGI